MGGGGHDVRVGPSPSGATLGTTPAMAPSWSGWLPPYSEATIRVCMGIGLRGPCVRMTREYFPQTQFQIPRAGPCCFERIPAGPPLRQMLALLAVIGRLI